MFFVFKLLSNYVLVQYYIQKQKSSGLFLSKSWQVWMGIVTEFFYRDGEYGCDDK